MSRQHQVLKTKAHCCATPPAKNSRAPRQCSLRHFRKAAAQRTTTKRPAKRRSAHTATAKALTQAANQDLRGTSQAEPTQSDTIAASVRGRMRYRACESLQPSSLVHLACLQRSCRAIAPILPAPGCILRLKKNPVFHARSARRTAPETAATALPPESAVCRTFH